MGNLARRLLAGAASRTEIETEVALRWARGDFVHHLGAGAIAGVAPASGRPASYGANDVLEAEVVDPAAGGVGCIVITTPPQGRCDEDLRSFLVPPHRHRSAHVAVLLRGEARFVVARDTIRGAVAVVEPVSAGSLIFCPAEAPHTFMGEGGFVVVSAHARPLAPDQPGYSLPSTLDLHVLPRSSCAALRTGPPVEEPRPS